jgi:hypothetical protein
MPEITLYDYLLLPVYLLIIYKIAFSIRDKYYPKGHILRKFFLPGLTVKILGAIAIGLIYTYYYNGGDTFVYFEHSKNVTASLKEGRTVWWDVLTYNIDTQNPTARLYLDNIYMTSTDTIATWQLTWCLSMLSFNTYLPLSIIMAALSFSGIWQMLRICSRTLQINIKQAAIAFLFIPTVVIWGSGLFKDTFCIMSMGWLVWSVDCIRRKRKIFIAILLFLLSSWILIKIKIYIFFIFFPLYIASILAKKILSLKPLKKLLLLSLILISLKIMLPKALDFIGNEVQKYSLENLTETIVTSKEYFLRLAEEDAGSTFNLGYIEPTIQGITSKIIPAVNAGLFRPYLWEARKPFLLLAALEAMLFSILFITAMLRLIRYRNFSFLKDPFIWFSILYPIIFSFVVSITTSNFGSLSRYRIPMLPFFAIALFAIIQQNRLHLSHEYKEPPALENN